MKKTTITFASTVLLVLGSINVNSQTAAKKTYPEPDFKDKPYYFDEAKNELLEPQSGQLIQDFRRSGFSAEEEFYYAEGEKATLRVKKTAKITFVVKWTNKDDDPAGYELMKLNYNVKKKRREVVMEQKSTYNNSKNAAEVKIFFKTKDGQEIWTSERTDYPKFYIKLFVIENLEAGEYVWKYGLRDAVFFGVDE